MLPLDAGQIRHHRGLVEVRHNTILQFRKGACIMVRKCAFVFGILLGVSALVVDGSASTAEACGGCRTRCCRPRCCAPTCCTTTCYAPAPCCSSCGTVYVAPSCSTCSTGYYAYSTLVYVSQVPSYGAQYSYAAPVLSAPSRVVYRARLVSVR